MRIVFHRYFLAALVKACYRSIGQVENNFPFQYLLFFGKIKTVKKQQIRHLTQLLENIFRKIVKYYR